jgi:hypothetical protein
MCKKNKIQENKNKVFWVVDSPAIKESVLKIVALLSQAHGTSL